jgi:hypothetical protein
VHRVGLDTAGSANHSAVNGIFEYTNQKAAEEKYSPSFVTIYAKGNFKRKTKYSYAVYFGLDQGVYARNG